MSIELLSLKKLKEIDNVRLAQENSDKVLSESRVGIDIDLDTIDQIENTIVPLIKNKKQSVNQVYSNHSDILYFCKTTFYKYIDLGVLSLSNLDLPKKVKYKKRKSNKDTDYKRKLALLKNRTYEDCLEFIIKHPKMNVCEMDTVEGNKGGKVFLTILIKDTKFMFIRLLDKKDVASVKKKLNKKYYYYKCNHCKINLKEDTIENLILMELLALVYIDDLFNDYYTPFIKSKLDYSKLN